MELQGKRVIVVGLGKSGQSAARACVARGARVLGTDVRAEIGVELPGVDLVLGGHDAVPFETADLIVVSPGVPSLPRIEEATRRGVEVIGELELGCRFTRAPIVAVGGTNGKSTTTTLVGDMLAAERSRVFVGGNLGRPFTDVLDEAWDAVVLEVSSFQLERVREFHPKAAILLNVSEDHLDRYVSLEAYAAAKGNAFQLQGPGDAAIVPMGDAVCLAEARRGGGRVVTFGAAAERDSAPDYVVGDRGVTERATGHEFVLTSTELVGAHNWSNAAAAIAAARALGTSHGAIERGLAKFRPLPHRLARVATKRQVTYYDDSKGTNVDAAATAVRGLPEPRVVLIAGGRDKLGDYAPLVAALAEKRGAFVLIGEATERIAKAAESRVPSVRATDMVDAVRQASELARPGDAVLLSPACSSFDMFTSYAERGDRFAEAVRALSNGGNQ